MIGNTPLTRARTRELDRIIEIGVLYPIGRIVHSTYSPSGLPPNPAVAEFFREVLPPNLAIIEERLRDGRPLLMGDQASIADCTLAAALQFGRMAKVEIGSEYENIARWDLAFRERISAKQVLVL